MPTRYLVTPHKGRVAKSREVQPIQVETDSLPHDVHKLQDAITRGLHKYFRRQDAFTVLELPSIGPGQFRARLYHGDGTLAAALYVDQIEE